MKKFYLESNGCSVVRHDTQRYSKYFRLNGWEELTRPEEADLILYTTCGVIEETEEFALQSISNLNNKLKRGASLLVSGCLTKINPERLAEVFHGETFSKENEHRLDEIIKADICIKDVFWDGDIVREHSLGDPILHYTKDEIDELKAAEILSERLENPSFLEIYNYTTKGRFFWKEDGLFEVKVADGCLYNCSYCATKKAKGNLKSRPLDKIVSEVSFGVQKGYDKIVLTGDEVGEYGRDIGSDLPGLLKAVLPVLGNSRVAIRYITPEALIKYHTVLEEYFKSGKIYYFCAAFQSGSPKIVKAMNRPQNVEELIKVVRDINEKYPRVYKHTQTIVGFPGESETDFLLTLEVLKKSKFDYITVTKYSDRPGTRSSKMEGHLSKEVIDRRYGEAKSLTTELRILKIKERFIKEVLSSD